MMMIFATRLHDGHTFYDPTHGSIVRYRNQR